MSDARGWVVLMRMWTGEPWQPLWESARDTRAEAIDEYKKWMGAEYLVHCPQMRYTYRRRYGTLCCVRCRVDGEVKP